jgi:uncharacterized protein
MTIRLSSICRHPIKAYGREMLASVRLSAGAGLPFDREWAVAHEAANLAPGWNPCMNFTRGAKAPALMAVTARLDEGLRTRPRAKSPWPPTIPPITPHCSPGPTG